MPLYFWFNHFSNSRAEFCLIFRSFFWAVEFREKLLLKFEETHWFSRYLSQLSSCKSATEAGEKKMISLRWKAFIYRWLLNQPTAVWFTGVSSYISSYYQYQANQTKKKNTSKPHSQIMKSEIIVFKCDFVGNYESESVWNFCVRILN